MLIHLSLWLNRARGGRKGYTVCQEEWERRLNGDRLAYLNVIILDTIFKMLENEHQHCRVHWTVRNKK